MNHGLLAAGLLAGSRSFFVAALALCLAGDAAVIASPQVATRNAPASDVLEQLGLLVPMRDGIQLAADLYLPHDIPHDIPRGGGRWPTLLVRTPYSRKTASIASYRFFARRGYAVVIEDVRGSYASQGTFGPVSEEGPDGSDTVDWIAEQAWSNGRVGMVGSSYLGMTQWWAAVQGNPHLLTISPMCSGDDDYLDRFYSPGGALQIGHRLLWLAENLTPPSHVRPLFTSYIDHLPLRSADILASGMVLPVWRTALSHPSYDDYWKRLSVREQLPRVTIPVLSLGGWFDNYVASDLDAFSRLAKRRQRIETWIGPWGHNPGLVFPTRDFGPQAAIPIRGQQLEWFDRWLKATPAERSPPPANNPPGPLLHILPSLHIFVMGPNVWREEREWPLARTHYTPLYLNSKGGANSVAGDGVLNWQPVQKAPPDTFTYDPKNPVPTTGGTICCDPVAMPPGPLDQTRVEARPDVLIYTSPPLAEDLEVTGPVRAVLYVSTSANDTDFTAKLVDVQPDGRPLLVVDGLQRMRYRLSLNQPVFVKRNETYQISVDTGVTSYVFLPGHRIRLEVSSSNFPKYDRSLNTFRLNADESKITKARQIVHHEKGYPSAILLPIIPRAGVRERIDRLTQGPLH